MSWFGLFCWAPSGGQGGGAAGGGQGGGGLGGPVLVVGSVLVSVGWLSSSSFSLGLSAVGVPLLACISRVFKVSYIIRFLTY